MKEDIKEDPMIAVMKANFAKLSELFAVAQGARLDKMNERLDKMNERLEMIEAHLTTVVKKIDDMDDTPFEKW